MLSFATNGDASRHLQIIHINAFESSLLILNLSSTAAQRQPNRQHSSQSHSLRTVKCFRVRPRLFDPSKEFETPNIGIQTRPLFTIITSLGPPKSALYSSPSDRVASTISSPSWTIGFNPFLLGSNLGLLFGLSFDRLFGLALNPYTKKYLWPGK